MEWRELTENEPDDGKERLYAQWFHLASPPHWSYDVFDDPLFASRRGCTMVADIQAPEVKP